MLGVLRIAAFYRSLEELESCRRVAVIRVEAGDVGTEDYHTVDGDRGFDTSAESL